MARILYITYDGLTDPLGQSQIIPYLKGLAQFGNQITILSAEKKERYGVKNEVIRATLKESHIQWIHTFYTKNPPVISTLLDIWKLKNKAWELTKKHQYDIVHCRSYLSSLIGLKLKQKTGTKFIFDMRGFWADERVDGELWNLKNPVYHKIYNYFKKKEKSFLLESDSIISLTEAGKSEMLTWEDSDLFKNKIEVIPCCVDLNLFNPEKVNKKEIEDLRNELNLEKSAYILTYLGSIGTWYMLPEMLIYFNHLKSVKSDSKMVFITPTSDHHSIWNNIDKYDINEEDIRVVESPREQVPVYLSLSDYSIFFIKPSYSKISSSPTKQGEIMALGIPIVCNKGVGDTTEIVNTYQSGISIDHIDKVDFSHSVQAMLESEKNIQDLRNGAIDYFSLEKGVKKYSDIYNTLVAKS